MAFDVVDRKPGGQSGTLSIGGSGEAVEVWEVVADNNDYTTEDLRNSGIFPNVYESFHLQNPRLRLQPIAITQDEEAPSRFTCTLKWSSDKLDPKEEEQKDDSPLDRRPRITVKTSTMRETRHRDFYGKIKVNAAGDLFDPPIESNVSFLIINIRKNVTAFPDWVFEYSDAINSTPFTIAGRTIDTGCAWIASIELGEVNTDGPVEYCESRLEMHIRRRRQQTTAELATTPPTIPPSPWQTEQLNEGLFELVAGVHIPILVSDGGTPSTQVRVPAPVPLTAAGAQLSPVTVDNATFITFRDHEELDFSALSPLWS